MKNVLKVVFWHKKGLRFSWQRMKRTVQKED